MLYDLFLFGYIVSNENEFCKPLIKNSKHTNSKKKPGNSP